MSSRGLTYADIRRTGERDCQNVFDITDFDLRQGGTAIEIVERQFKEWEADDIKKNWSSDFDDELKLYRLDPDKAYEHWKAGWMSCAKIRVVNALQQQLDRMELWYLEDDNEDIIEVFDDDQVALDVLARIPGNAKLLIGDGNGPNEHWVKVTAKGDDLVVYANTSPRTTSRQREDFREARAAARARNFTANATSKTTSKRRQR